MKICIVGGIFDKAPEYRASHRLTPETILADGLSSAGVSVGTAGLHEAVNLAPFDIVHVHHLGAGGLRAILDPDVGLVYTNRRPFVGSRRGGRSSSESTRCARASGTYVPVRPHAS